MTQLTIPGSELVTRGPQESLVAAALAAFERVKDPFALNTSKAYARASRSFGRWCDAFGRAALPLEPGALVAYLEWLARPDGGNAAPNTVRAHLAALASIDRASRVTPTNPTPASVASSPIVERWLKSWSREHPRAPRKKAPVIEVAELWRLLEAVNEPTPRAARAAHVARATRDRAMILIGISGGLRVSELAALHVEHLRVVPRGLELYRARAKTDQAGAGKWNGIMPGSARALCPVEAWQAWLRYRGEWAGPAFVPIYRDGNHGGAAMHPRTLQKLITSYAKRAGLELVSSHSMRATLATLATRRGHRLEAVAEHLGHSSLQTTAGYARRASLFDERNPTAGLFDE